MAKKSKAVKKQNVSRPASTHFSGPMDPTLLERLIQMMSANDVSSLEVSEGQQRISLQRGPKFVAGPAAPIYAAPAPVAAPTAQPAASPAAPAADDTAGLKAIKSPMVGTFYSKPSPDAKSFVSVGSTIDEDTDVCIIEAMKVFNNIKAETRGTIAKVCVADGQTVEFGTVLFLVK
jgi:acetyl-CoA carboxylase biotin carboxyl carrier protein